MSSSEAGPNGNADARQPPTLMDSDSTDKSGEAAIADLLSSELGGDSDDRPLQAIKPERSSRTVTTCERAGDGSDRARLRRT